MPAVARSSGTDSVLSPDGTGKKCRFPLRTRTGVPNQTKVRAQGVFVVVVGDPVAPHLLSGCSTIDESTLGSGSSKVSAGGSPVARIGDSYGNNIITSGSTKVMAA
jgi:uncharacterized Zn-binding protein involved in type VI secretion